MTIDSSTQSEAVDPAKLAAQRSVVFWLSLSLTFAAVYGVLALQQAFSSEFMVQDDARQHVFWMQRFVDPTLFPNDLIANYFQSVAPLGYSWLYRLAAGLGIEPLLFSKLLPPLLGLVSTGICFLIVLELFPVPMAGFVTSLLLNQTLWMNDDLVSATPRAFIYPLFLGFCYFLLRRSLLPCGAMIGLLGLFYPQAVFLAAGLLVAQVVQWSGWRPQWSRARQDYWFCGVGLAVAVAVMLPYALSLSEFDPVVTLTEARQMPEFQKDGRSDFFNSNVWEFWLTGLRSGVLPYLDRLPELLITAVLLPLLLYFRRYFPLTQQLRPAVALLPQLLVVSLLWFGAAHALLFKLHLPSRYTQHSFRLVLCWAAGMAIVIGLDAVRRMASRANSPLPQRWLALGLTVVVAGALIFFPSYTPEFPRTRYLNGTQPDLYRFLRQQPADALVASLLPEADYLPSFAQRSVYVAKEYAIPYHMGYYRPFQQRVARLIEAQYSPGLPKLKQFIRESGVDFWLLDAQALTPASLENAWLRQYPDPVKLARRTFRQQAGQRARQKAPALAQMIQPCTVFQSRTDQANQDADGLILLDTACILRQTPAANES